MCQMFCDWLCEIENPDDPWNPDYQPDCHDVCFKLCMYFAPDPGPGPEPEGCPPGAICA